MNSSLAIALLCGLVAAVTASGLGYADGARGVHGINGVHGGRGVHGGYGPSHGNSYGGYGYGFSRSPNAIVAAYNNADRQLAVNHVAEHVGASSGTARWYGVPGTGNYFNHPGYGAGYGASHAGGAGYGVHGAGYGTHGVHGAGAGSYGAGDAGYASKSYGQRETGYGAVSYGQESRGYKEH